MFDRWTTADGSTKSSISHAVSVTTPPAPRFGLSPAAFDLPVAHGTQAPLETNSVTLHSGSRAEAAVSACDVLFSCDVSFSSDVSFSDVLDVVELDVDVLLLLRVLVELLVLLDVEL